MNLAVVVESGGQRRVRRVDLAPGGSVLVGRAWHADVVLDDEYADAEHLRLEMDEAGELRIRDLDTRNGTRLNGRRLTGESSCAPGATVAVGDSRITLHDAREPVAPATALDGAQRAARRFGSPLWALLAAAIAAGALVVDAHFGSGVEATGESLAEGLLGAALGAAGWALAAGLVSKLFRHRIWWTLHWSVACLAITFVVALSLAVDAARFNLDSDLAEAVLTNGSGMLAILLFAYAALSLGTRLRAPAKAGLAAALCLLPVLVETVVPSLAEEHERWSDIAPIDRVNLPPALRVGEPVALEAHLEAVDGLIAELEARVGEGDRKTPRGDDGGGQGDVRLSDAD